MKTVNNNKSNKNKNNNNSNGIVDHETSQVVKLRKENLLKCLTCPLCHDLFSDATTVSECLHTFCRKCICDKIEDEDLNCCPVCKAYLGCDPFDKLRADNNLQDLRTKLFPPESEKDEAVPDPEPPVALPVKKRSLNLSPPVADSPKPLNQPDTTVSETSPKKRRIVLALASPLLDAANPEEFRKRARKGKKSTKQAPVNVEHKENGPAEASEGQGLRAEVEFGWQSKRPRGCGDGSASTSSLLGSVARESVQRQRKSKEKMVPESESLTSAEVARDSGQGSGQSAKRFKSIWFSLVASKHQEGSEPFPQISSSYLRVKDGSLSVSVVKKYVAQKLGLPSEAEVELTLKGWPLISTLNLDNLVDLWRRMLPASGAAINPWAGGSGEGIVLVLCYGRKASPMP